MATFTARNYKGEMRTIEVDGERVHSDGAVALVKRGGGFYTVVYGLEVTHWSDYVGAAHGYGRCVFHQLACDGKLD